MLLGIDLGGTNIRIGQVEDGRVVEKISEPSPAAMELTPSLEYLKHHIGRMMTPAVEAIGIGIPSVVDPLRGIVYNVTNIPSWREVHLKDFLQEEFSVPVSVNNDANTFVLGEQVYGLAGGLDDVVGVTLGTGVGAGIVIDGKLYTGRNCGAGEIGSLPWRDATLEDYCGSNFFSQFHGITARDAAFKAAQGDRAALRLWEEYGAHIGDLVQVVLYTYDPEMILFGGGITSAWNLFERAMRKKMAEFPYPETLAAIRIERSHNPHIQILGAAALTTI